LVEHSAEPQAAVSRVDGEVNAHRAWGGETVEAPGHIIVVALEEALEGVPRRALGPEIVGRLGGCVADLDDVRAEQPWTVEGVVERQAGVARVRVVGAAMFDPSLDAVLEADGRLQVEAVVAGTDVVRGETQSLGFRLDITHTSVERGVLVDIGPAGGVVVVLRPRAVQPRRTAPIDIEPNVALAVVSPQEGVHHAHELPSARNLQEQVVAA